MVTYFIAMLVAGAVLLISVAVALIIKYEMQVNSKDKTKRKVWFWVLAVVNPVLFYVLAGIILLPANPRLRTEWEDSLPIALIVGFVFYILLGIVLSKLYRTRKLGNWFH